MCYESHTGGGFALFSLSSVTIEVDAWPRLHSDCAGPRGSHVRATDQGLTFSHRQTSLPTS